MVLYDSGACRPIIDLSTLNSFNGKNLLSAQGAVLRHHCVVGMLRYLDNWWILAESRTTSIQARARLLQVCEELGLQVIAESRL